MQSVPPRTEGEAFQVVCDSLALDIAPLSLGDSKQHKAVRLASVILAEVGSLVVHLEQDLDDAEEVFAQWDSGEKEEGEGERDQLTGMYGALIHVLDILTRSVTSNKGEHV